MNIIMYTKNNCPNCMRAEFMFSACPTTVNIEKRNVETESKFMEELKELESNTLPTIVIGKNVYRGFEENLGKLQEELGL
ncbi:NrdH-redoxin family protein [Bacillus phage QCM11]|uniref:NrdH-redoxin family protein n=1 Tax=Bacillus phage QCM11 TaxID=1909400 RepID=A0A1I9S6L9_9CAUD|nr:thioredoxin domain [Bacillus phage QCM11]AOZ62213.1 NrdH-redoxin family protein [Bacillus phage QCM11]